MSSKLHIKTRYTQENDAGEEQPMSPGAEIFNSKALSVCNLAIFEFEVPLDDLPLVQLAHDVFFPMNPRFSSIMVSDKEGVRRWERVEVNTEEDHVKIPSFPEGLTIREYDILLDEYLTELAAESLPEDKPMWQIHRFKYPTSKAAENIILKIHQSIGDGYSLMGTLLCSMQRADDPSIPLTFPSTRREAEANDRNKTMDVINYVSTSLSSIYHGMCDFVWGIAKTGWIVDDKTPIRSGSEGVGFHPAVRISTVDLSLDKLKEIKTKLNTTLNAVLTGIIFFGARLYMQEIGECFKNSRSTVVVLLNTRNVKRYMSVDEMLKADNKLWGNQSTFFHIPLPELTNHNCSHPLDFVLVAQKLIMMKKNSSGVYLIGHFLELVKKFRGSETAAEYVKGALRNSSLSYTSMIGPIEKMAINNKPIKGLYFTCTGAHQSLLISAMSYMGTLRIGIAAELDFIDSPKFNSCMERAFQLIYDAATSSTK